MKIIGFGQRKNLLHPFMLLLSVGIIKIIESLIDSNFKMGKFCLQIIYSLSRFISGFSLFLYTSKKPKSYQKLMNKNKKVKNKDSLNNDNIFKIIILLIFASYYDFIVSLIINFFGFLTSN